MIAASSLGSGPGGEPLGLLEQAHASGPARLESGSGLDIERFGFVGVIVEDLFLEPVRLGQPGGCARR